MKSRPATIAKYVNFLNAFQEGKKYNASKVMERFSVGRSATFIAKELGYLKVDDDGYTVAALPGFTEEHAKNLLNAQNKYAADHQNRGGVESPQKRRKNGQPREGTAKEREAIKLLKALGYKIMKPVSEFVEI